MNATVHSNTQIIVMTKFPLQLKAYLSSQMGYHIPCEGVSIRPRSYVLTPLRALQLTNMYFGTFPKNYCPDSFEIFTVSRGHRCHQNVKNLRESDKGIFRGEGGKKNFRPPISPLREVMGAPWQEPPKLQKFFCQFFGKTLNLLSPHT